MTPPRTPLDRAPPVLDPAIDAHLQLDDTFGGHPSYGERSRVGIIDSGVDSQRLSRLGTPFGAHRVADPSTMDTSVPDKLGHGTQVARIILGYNVDGHPGGVAQRATLASFRYLQDDAASVQNVKADGTFTAGAQWLADGGANVVNVSTDRLRWDTEAGRNELYDGFSRLASRDALIVVAAGDATDFEPSQLAKLPLTGADPQGVRDNWLVVGAVSSEMPDRLSSTSNACGVAKDICLMATGDVKTVDPNATGLVNAHGTDFAAAQVSGAAAVVRDRFTYLSAEQTRQILLGTATDLGAAGVDDVFGHGRIDLEKAINGPGRLDWGQMQFDFSGIVSSGFGGNWANDMSGQGGLTLYSNRSLLMFLSGNNTYTGPTVVHGTSGMTVGILGEQASDVIVRDAGWVTLADGALLKADVRAETGTGGVTFGTPSGAGWPSVRAGDVRVLGELSNASKVQLPSSGIAVHVGGDYLQSDTGMLSMYLGGKPLDIAGTARLDGRLRIAGTVNGYVFNARADVLNASQVEGTFDSVDWTAPSYLLSATPHYEPQGVWLELTRNSVTATASRLGLSAAAVQGAQRVEEAFGQLDATPASADPAFLSAAAALQASDSAAGLERSLASLSGEFHAMDAGFIRMTMDDARHSLEARMDAVGAGDVSHLWSRSFEQQRADGGVDVRASGWTMGADVTRANGATMGLSMTASDGNRWHGARSDREHARLFEGQWYSNWGLGEGRYLLGSVGVGQGRRALRREIDLGADRYRVDSDLRERHATLGLQAGARVRWSATSVVPYMGLQAIRLQRDAFREEGAAGFGLAAPASDATAAMGILGARMNHQMPFASAEWMLQGRIEWQSLLSQSGGMRARFTGLDAWAPLDGTGWGEDMGLFELGLERQARGAQLRLNFGMRSTAGSQWSTAMLEWQREF
ncbi:S8 family serine peptidase [Lysobacter sp. OAE881]|uniref:S8 family serine peptidase n=1 Tax=Lysobacter sp. OAE881 TaxID=2663813 RepID=UPI0017896512